MDTIIYKNRIIPLIGLTIIWFFNLAWVYPEHREISMIAINNLDPDRQRVLARLWADACMGYEHRLNKLPADTTLGERPTTLANMAVVAGNGGLIGWQTGIATSIGRFQFLLGREISVYFYGYGSKKDRGLAYYNNDESAGLMLIDIRTLRLDFPIFEYRPFRSFSSDQSSSLDIQITGGIEFPIHVNTIEPVDVPDPQVKNIYHIGLRVAFDWRGYF
jgi:hypothetical protein